VTGLRVTWWLTRVVADLGCDVAMAAEGSSDVVDVEAIGGCECSQRAMTA